MPAINSSKYVVTGGWSDVPHIDEETKREIEANTPPHLRRARMHGEPPWVLARSIRSAPTCSA